jgi:hypothetical protein
LKVDTVWCGKHKDGSLKSLKKLNVPDTFILMFNIVSEKDSSTALSSLLPVDTIFAKTDGALEIHAAHRSLAGNDSDCTTHIRPRLFSSAHSYHLSHALPVYLHITHHRPHTFAMTSTIGIPIKLLNEATVRASPSFVASNRAHADGWYNRATSLPSKSHLAMSTVASYSKVRPPATDRKEEGTGHW